MTRKDSGTKWPHPRSESDEEAAAHGAEEHQEGRLPAGGDARKSVDWMDFDKADGGPTRTPVHLGEHDLPSEPGASDAGIEVGDTDEKPDTVSKMSETAREE